MRLWGAAGVVKAKRGVDYSRCNEERMNAERVRESPGLVQLLGGGSGGRWFAHGRPFLCLREREGEYLLLF